MNLRDSKSRLILIVLAIGLVLIIVVASCGGDNGDSDDGAGGSTPAAESSEDEDSDADDGSADDESNGEDDPEEPSGEPLAQVSGEEDITLTITRAQREEGGFLTVEGTVHNGGGSGWGAAKWRGTESELAGNDFSMAGATLTAKAEGKRYLILRDTSGRCLCTRFDLQIPAGDTVSWFAQFPEPDPETTEVDFQIGQMPPATFAIN